MERRMPEKYEGRGSVDLVRRRPAIQAATDKAEPIVFSLKAPLPSVGRDRLFVSATDRMTVYLMTHAVGDSGEIELHAHAGEDHTFVVLQGAARFGDKDGNEFDVRRHEGVTLPRKTYYRFCVIGDEPLVMLRMGCWMDPDKVANMRIDPNEASFNGDQQQNADVTTKYLPNTYFE